MNRLAQEKYIDMNYHNQELFGTQYAIKVSETQQIPSRPPTLYNTSNHCNYTPEKCKRYAVIPF